MRWLSLKRRFTRLAQFHHRSTPDGPGQLLQLAALEASALALAAAPQVVALNWSAFCPVVLGSWFGALRMLCNLMIEAPLIELQLAFSGLPMMTSLTLGTLNSDRYHDLTNDAYFRELGVVMPPGCLPPTLRVLRLFDHAVALPEAVHGARHLSFLIADSGSLHVPYDYSGLEGLPALRTLAVQRCSGRAPQQVLRSAHAKHSQHYV